MNKKNKVIVILGTTASGKTSLGVSLAYKLGGEIVSADSRQVYKGMDIGTGKDLAEYKVRGKKIPYHMIDVANPKRRYSLAEYQNQAFTSIDDVIARDKLPLLVGGSGQYLEAVVDNYQLSDAKPNKELRKELEKLSVEELYKKLLKLNKKFAQKLHESDQKNKRRLIRYIEVFTTDKKESTSSRGGKTKEKKAERKYDALIIGLTFPNEVLDKRIRKRLKDRFEKEGMVEEVERLHNVEKVSWKRLLEFGLEYKFISQYLMEEMEYDDMFEKLAIAIRQFTKKQKSWFKRWEKKGTKIHWVKDKKEAELLIEKFLK